MNHFEVKTLSATGIRNSPVLSDKMVSDLLFIFPWIKKTEAPGTGVPPVLSTFPEIVVWLWTKDGAISIAIKINRIFIQ